jgi:hypothetical protein
MDLRLHLLDSFVAQGSDGASYKVYAYERMVPLPGLADQWESSGEAEYRLEDGRLVDVDRDGTLHVVGTDVQLSPAAGTRLH